MEEERDWNVLTPLEKADALAERGERAFAEGQEQLAYNCYGQSLHLYRGLEDRPNILRCLMRLSNLAGWADFGDGLDMFARRRRLAEEALPLAREIGDKALLAQALYVFSAGMPNEHSDAMLQESVALAEESGDKKVLARALYFSANRSALKRDEESAQKLREQAYRLYQEIGDKGGMANVLNLWSISAKGEQRRAYLEQALELNREIGAKRRMAEILIRLATTCKPEELERREAYNQEALVICRQINSPIWEAGCLKRLAEVARARGEEERAEALERESRSVYEEPEEDPELKEAFAKALESGDVQKMTDALKQIIKS